MEEGETFWLPPPELYCSCTPIAYAWRQLERGVSSVNDRQRLTGFSLTDRKVVS